MRNGNNRFHRHVRILRDMLLKILIVTALLAVHEASASGVVSTLSYIQQLLMEIGPLLSAVLFIVAGIFYAIGQLLPPEKKAVFHTTSINVIIGAIIVAVLSVASNSLAIASTHLLTNLTANAVG